jgi:hypothetical protein
MSSVAALFSPVRHLTANFGTSTTPTIQVWGIAFPMLFCFPFTHANCSPCYYYCYYYYYYWRRYKMFKNKTQCNKQFYSTMNQIFWGTLYLVIFLLFVLYKKVKHSNTPIFNIIKIQHHNPPSKVPLYCYPNIVPVQQVYFIVKCNNYLAYMTMC